MPTPKRVPTNLAKLAQTVVAEMQDLARQQGTRLQCSTDCAPLEAHVDPTQIAVALKVPEGTVKSRINRGRAELARLLSRINKQAV